MKTFTCTKFQGHFPVGSAAVVTAKTRERARSVLSAELKRNGLKGDELLLEDLIELNTKLEGVAILCDGNY